MLRIQAPSRRAPVHVGPQPAGPQPVETTRGRDRGGVPSLTRSPRADAGTARLLRAALLTAGLLAGCGESWGDPRALDELVLRDSTYYDPVSLQPYTGPVERRFPEVGAIQMSGFLQDGTWSGELRVYHPNGRLRYLGSLHDGAPCGEWIEEQGAEDPGSLYEQLVEEIESMAVYPPCP